MKLSKVLIVLGVVASFTLTSHQTVYGEGTPKWALDALSKIIVEWSTQSIAKETAVQRISEIIVQLASGDPHCGNGKVEWGEQCDDGGVCEDRGTCMQPADCQPVRYWSKVCSRGSMQCTKDLDCWDWRLGYIGPCTTPSPTKMLYHCTNNRTLQCMTHEQCGSGQCQPPNRTDTCAPVSGDGCSATCQWE